MFALLLLACSFGPVELTEDNSRGASALVDPLFDALAADGIEAYGIGFGHCHDNAPKVCLSIDVEKTADVEKVRAHGAKALADAGYIGGVDVNLKDGPAVPEAK